MHLPTCVYVHADQGICFPNMMCIIFNRSSVQRVKLIFNSHCATLSDNNVVVMRNIK